MSLLGEAWNAYRNPINDGWGQTLTHIRLSLIAIAVATGVGVVLGVISAKIGRVAAFLVVTISSLGRIVPELAIIGLIAALWTIGFIPAVIALILLGIPPILFNTFTGLREVDAGALEAARGMGMTPAQTLARVELPLALPLVFAGIRTAAVQIVATAALAGLVGAGGLGVIVLSGLANGQNDVLLAGAIPIALLAVLAELLLGGAERLLTPKGLRISHRLATRQGRTT